MPMGETGDDGYAPPVENNPMESGTGAYSGDVMDTGAAIPGSYDPNSAVTTMPAGYAPPMDEGAGGVMIPPGGYGGAEAGYDPYNAGGGMARPAPPKPKTLKEKAAQAIAGGDMDQGLQLMAAHLLTTSKGGAEIDKYLQWAPALRRPALATRLGIAVVYTTQPANYDGPPQPIGSPELEAALAEQETNQPGREGGKRTSRKLGQRNRGGGAGAGGAAGAGIGPPNPADMAMDGDLYSGQAAQKTDSAAEELLYFTGELGTKLLDKLRTRLAAGDLGLIYKDALAAPPPAKTNNNQFPGGPGMAGAPGMADDYNPDEGNAVNIAPPGMMAAGGPGIPGAGGGAGGGGAQPAGPVTGQMIPGVEFLGAVENIKELGELAKSSNVDYLIAFEITVRPATVTKYVKNVTKFRVVSAADVTKPLYMSPTLDNKAVYEARKKKNADDPVDTALDGAMELIDKMKMAPLPALTPERALMRVNQLIEQAPADGSGILLEARLFLKMDLLKPEEMLNLTMTQITEAQLAGISEILDGADVKEKIASSLAGEPAAPTTVLGKFGAALSGAGGLSNLVPLPEMPAGLPLPMGPDAGPPVGPPGGPPGAQSGAVGPPAGFVPPGGVP
ncbi:MAG: hypothetical protein MUF06_09580 [Pirellulaceae bacterium]|jgi:hypothetical protein|nr:hypothetical protein [Pirellulaceae bacterium]